VDYTLILILVGFGLAGGFISGLLGVGGGIVFIPVLTSTFITLGFDDADLPKYILANSFAATFFAGAISSYKQYKLGSFYPRPILLTAFFAIPSSLFISRLIKTGHWYDKESFSIFFVVLLIIMLIRFLTSTKTGNLTPKEAKKYKFGITGALTGIIAALSGLGGGIIMVPLFTQYIKLDIKKAASISIGVIPLMMIPLIAYYGVNGPEKLSGVSQIGYLIPSAFLPLIGGLLFAAPLGVVAGKHASRRLLKIIFASLITIVIIKTIGNIIF